MPEITATIRVRDITDAIDRDHYLVAAYDSIESFNQRIVVIIPELAEPAWVMRPGARDPRRRSNVMALALPDLDELTIRIARELTRIGTDYISVRAFPREYRQMGIIRPGWLVRSFNDQKSSDDRLLPDGSMDRLPATVKPSMGSRMPDGLYCHYCGAAATSRDHVVAKARLGSNEW